MLSRASKGFAGQRPLASVQYECRCLPRYHGSYSDSYLIIIIIIVHNNIIVCV
jgi:hypothetical protein